MRPRLARLVLLPIVALLTLSLTRGQGPAPQTPGAPSPRAHPPTVPGDPSVAAGDMPSSAPLTDLQKQFLFCAQSGSDWLSRMNGDNGRFLFAWEPSLKRELEEDNYLFQAQAAYALARAARLADNEEQRKRYKAQAMHAIQLLLEDTVVENEQRHTALPSVFVNRVAAAGLLILAINELPAPPADLLDRSEQLCAFLRSRVRADGGLRCSDTADAAVNNPEEIYGSVHYAGVGLYALVVSQRHRPAPWKIEVVTRAAAFYLPGWRANKQIPFVAWHGAAYAEAFLLNKDRKLADAVLEMNDWVTTLQYTTLDQRHPLWLGGFAGFEKDQRVESAPNASSALCLEALAQACRVTRSLGDVERHQRYTTILENGLQFLLTLQYTVRNTQHFADWYRPRLVGGFFTSHQDGVLRLEHTPPAVNALTLYLEYVAH